MITLEGQKSLALERYAPQPRRVVPQLGIWIKWRKRLFKWLWHRLLRGRA